MALLVVGGQVQVIASIAHKAKRNECPCALIADGFTRDKDNDPSTPTESMAPPGPIDDAEARLAYVWPPRARAGASISGLRRPRWAERESTEGCCHGG